jgi:N-methylhydantoinase A
VASRVAQPLGLTPIEAAWGILTVLATNVTMAMRTITIERGYDPREFTLVPFGGMGPTIAGRIIGDLGIGRILVPRDPGTFSAFGMLVTDVHQTRSLTRITRLDAATPGELEEIFAAMEASALADLLQENFPRERLTTLRSAGMRYRGQSYEVSVPVVALTSDAAIDALGTRFHEAHRRRYGHMAETEAIEIVNFQVTAVGQIPKPRINKVEASEKSQAALPCERRTAYFGPTEKIQVPVFRRSTLAAGAAIEGPAVIEEKTSTVVLYPGQRATIDGHLNVEIEDTVAQAESEPDSSEAKRP